MYVLRQVRNSHARLYPQTLRANSPLQAIFSAERPTLINPIGAWRALVIHLAHAEGRCIYIDIHNTRCSKSISTGLSGGSTKTISIRIHVCMRAETGRWIDGHTARKIGGGQAQRHSRG